MRLELGDPLLLHPACPGLAWLGAGTSSSRGSSDDGGGIGVCVCVGVSGGCAREPYYYPVAPWRLL